MTVIGALSSFRELGKMSPHKRAWDDPFSKAFGTAILARCRLMRTNSRGTLDAAPRPSLIPGFQAFFHSAIVEYHAGVRSIFRPTIIFSKSAR